MIQIIELEDPRSRETFLSEINSEKDCFLVSDIKSQIAAERKILEKKGGISGQPVLRMTDFLKELFLQTHPHWHITPKAFLEEFFLQFTHQHKEPWINNIQDSRGFFAYFDQFLPVFSHPESRQLMQEWLRKTPAQKRKWQRWYHLSEDFFQLIQKKKWIHKEGIKGLLLNELPNRTEPFPWPHQIVADLGIHFDFCEQDILKTLSSFIKVTVLTPRPKQDILQSLPLYGLLKKTTPPSNKMILKTQNETKTNFFKVKYETALKESQGATGQIRKWLEQGVKASDIAVLAPDMEEYWFCLRPYLERENIKIQKNVTTTATDFPEVLFWLASLKTHIDWIDFPLLESCVFHNDPKILFSQFQSQFFQNPERSLSKQLFCRKDKMKSQEQTTSGREFMEWALSFRPQEMESSLWDKVLTAFQDVPLEARLQWKQWVRILEINLYHREMEFKKESGNGISCLSLNAIDSIIASHIFVMGLNEESLRNKGENSLSQKEWELLDQELGFPLPFPQGLEKELALQWLFQSSNLQEVFLSFSITNFLGQAQTPSVFFLLFEQFRSSTRELSEEEKNPETVWDNLKKQATVPEILHSRISPSSLHYLKETLKEDREGLCHPFAPNRISHFSPSSLHDYSRCPFIHTAQRLFKLKKDPLVDWELSPMDMGSLSHLFLEKLLFEYPSLEINEKEMEQLITEILTEKKRNLMDERQKNLTIKTLALLGKKFLKKEKERRGNYPHLKPLAGEKKIQCFWNEEKGTLNHEGEIAFKGYMDRVDFDPENKAYILWDYKRSLSSNTNMKNWLEKADFQLSFYAQALEQGLVEGMKPAPVEAAVYYGLRDFDYKGYVNKQGPYEKTFGNRSHARKKREEFETTQVELNKIIRNLLANMKKGIFSPNPKDLNSCKNCNWRKWCRARHLN